MIRLRSNHDIRNSANLENTNSAAGIHSPSDHREDYGYGTARTTTPVMETPQKTRNSASKDVGARH
jgi:hypothetical protein